MNAPAPVLILSPGRQVAPRRPFQWQAVAGFLFIRRKHDMDAFAKNRRSQAMRFTILKRRLAKQAAAALSDAELDRRITLATQQSPRGTGLQALVQEKNRRQHRAAPE